MKPQYRKESQRGVITVAALLLLIFVSVIVFSMMFTSSTETQLSGSDAEKSIAYYATEAAMEKMMVDLNDLYTTRLAPNAAMIEGLGNPALQPTLPGITYPEYTYTVPNVGGVPTTEVRTISGGPNEGLIASIIPITLDVTARRLGEAEVKMRRNVEVALIPVFQFGIFSDTDLSYFPGPNFDFAGRVHTNGNLFLATSNAAGLVFHSKITAVGEVIRRQLSNGVDTIADGRDKPVLIPTAPAGCDGARPACRDLQENEGSKQFGPTSADNPNWVNISTSTYNGMILNGDTGARALTLPFVASGLRNIDLVRIPPAGEDPLSPAGASRLYNQAQIRVLLANTQAELGGAGVRLANVNTPGYTNYANGVPVVGTGASYFFADANPTVGNPDWDPLWVHPNNADQTARGDFPLPPGPYPNGVWPLLDGYLLVQYRDSAGNWIDVTDEWLQLGFARGLNAPNQEAGITDTIHPNAIIRLQFRADRNDDGDLADGVGETTAITVAGSANSRYMWYPINLYDTREGEVRDTNLGAGNPSCSVAGIINVVELDIRNLTRWLSGAIGARGTFVDSAAQNGYILYFSDRRGARPNGAGDITGEFGYEDNINPTVAAGTPNNALDAPEDVNDNNALDVYGRWNLGDGFLVAAQGGDTAADRFDSRIDCRAVGRKNRVSGARRALKVINGSLANGVGGPPRAPGGAGGFSIASENPVYVQGNYNASNAGFGDPHAASAVMADTVTLLSRNWSDARSFRDPTNVGNRPALTSYYRMAVAAGKNKSFPLPGWAPTTEYGLDGGTHNFLRYLENWGGQTLYYRGSLVSLYHSEYGVGIYKCCNT
ncbi:MAG TPA: PilX N-terminal domain-containing pilus assembly protein, partial [Terriglobia bacterium]|nr:PilX N-terminal domain-containing pilus assembly protein [Terriglobia bacterium]